ncbi:filamentation induced by cAMP protein (plasmid) [Burkholderia sp. YI23]|nr:filamentation induced by cAMP protein [Burkholderia sp. YI23]
MHSALQRMLEAIDTNKAELHATRRLSPPAEASLQQRLRLEWTPDANATEHHTLSLRDAQVVLDNLKIGDKSLRQHCGIMGRSNAMRYIEKFLATKSQSRPGRSATSTTPCPSAASVRRPVATVMEMWRSPTREPRRLTSWIFRAELAAFVEWHVRAGDLHPIEHAADLHTRLVRIHTFVDGNGRTGRLLLNIESIKSSYSPAVIRNEDCAAYCDSLDDACVSNNYAGIARLIAESVLRSFGPDFDALVLAVDQAPSRVMPMVMTSPCRSAWKWTIRTRDTGDQTSVGEDHGPLRLESEI